VTDTASSPTRIGADADVVAYLGLGSNLGDRAAYLAAAVEALGATPGVHVRALSPLSETDAVADEPQPPYLNAVLALRTTLSPEALLALGLSVERRLGRERPPGRTRAPRTIDVDLLLHGAATVDRPGLVVPHPALLHRAFVRVPLADVAAPGLAHPVTGEPLDRCAPDPAVRRLG
jgi:2-amino-4-hydroxy-6-hydroxymethyldihydropteridine diphosphokinase